MITLLAPLFLYIALGVAAGAAALHFIVMRQPASSPLPTVRFVPKSTVRVITVSRPEDLLLLLLRVLIILLIGLAFARPVLVLDRRPVARIVLADVSRSVGEVQAVRDSARALLRERDVLIVFDSAAHVVRRGAVDAAGRLERSAREGRLSSALIAALRTASELRARADSIEIAIVSPFRTTEVDGATRAIRALWPGRIRLVPVAANADSLAPPAGVLVRGPADDGVALAARLAGLDVDVGVHAAADEDDDEAAGEVRGSAGRAAGGNTPGSVDPGLAVRLARGPATAEDSAWAAAGRRALVRWPAEGAPPGWRARVRPDTPGAVVAGEAAVVYPLERRWGPDPAAAPSRVVARWVDGEPAAVERVVGAGCIRNVAIPVPKRGDLVLRPSFGRLVRALGAPCRATTGSTGLDTAALRALAGAGPLAAREAIPRADRIATPLVPWLLAAALALAVLELWARRGAAPLGSEPDDDGGGAARGEVAACGGAQARAAAPPDDGASMAAQGEAT